MRAAGDHRARLLDGVDGGPSLAQLARGGTLCLASAGRLDPALLEALTEQAAGDFALVLLLDRADVRLADRTGEPAVELAPLRARAADLSTLAERMATRMAGRPLRLDDASTALLARRAWPGNLAELAAVVAAAVAHAAPGAEALTPADLRDGAP
jgi:hypothetical protein